MASLIPYFITGGGFAGLVAVCFMAGYIYPRNVVEMKDKQLEQKDKEILEYKAALALERARSDTGVLAVTVAKDVMAALREEAK